VYKVVFVQTLRRMGLLEAGLNCTGHNNFFFRIPDHEYMLFQLRGATQNFREFEYTAQTINGTNLRR
jgi:hypothetical protein